MQNRTGLVFCALTLLTGFLIICLAAFLISSEAIFHCQRNSIIAYSLLLLGFGILLSGIFWSTYSQANESKGVFSQVLGQQHAHRSLPLATVDRPDFYPPAYEESLDAGKQTRPAEVEALNIPPPLYSATGLECQGASDVHAEAPPSYRQSLSDLASAGTSENAERPSPVLKAGNVLQHPELALVGVSCS